MSAGAGMPGIWNACANTAALRWSALREKRPTDEAAAPGTVRRTSPIRPTLQGAGVCRLAIEETIMGRTPNDDRSDSKNQNNDAYKSSQDNRSRQLNEEDERYGGAKAPESDEDDA
jgi:hypothetical protein